MKASLTFIGPCCSCYPLATRTDSSIGEDKHKVSLEKIQVQDRLSALIHRAMNRGSPEIAEEKKGKGLEFMAYRLEIAQVHLRLSIQKKITPAEHNLLRLLELCTIGAQNSRSYICSKIDFQIEDLSNALGYKEPAKIWRLLKSLENKKIILREKTRAKGTEILGLNPEVFGRILISRHEALDKKRHLRIAVDNTRSRVDKSKCERTKRA